ncbi:MAG: sigma-70 family RNA polymerase sigma factor [Acidobacteriota bacterium]
MKQPSGEITRLLDQLRDGDQEARERLIPLIYDELRQLASHYLGREPAGHTLQTTALVHETYLRMRDPGKDASWKDRVHFFALAATAMRRILVDHARSRHSQKRGGTDRPLALDEVVVVEEGRLEEILAMDEALSRLSQWDLRQSRIVELRFFGGLTEKEIAQALGVSLRTVKRDWRLARAWLRAELRG